MGINQEKKSEPTSLYLSFSPQTESSHGKQASSDASAFPHLACYPYRESCHPSNQTSSHHFGNCSSSSDYKYCSSTKTQDYLRYKPVRPNWTVYDTLCIYSTCILLYLILNAIGCIPCYRASDILCGRKSHEFQVHLNPQNS